MSEPPEISSLKALTIPAQLSFQACFGLCRASVKGRPGIAFSGVPVVTNRHRYAETE
jgi:hypothetical protein